MNSQRGILSRRRVEFPEGFAVGRQILLEPSNRFAIASRPTISLELREIASKVSPLGPTRGRKRGTWVRQRSARIRGHSASILGTAGRLVNPRPSRSSGLASAARARQRGVPPWVSLLWRLVFASDNQPLQLSLTSRPVTMPRLGSRLVPFAVESPECSIRVKFSRAEPCGVSARASTRIPTLESRESFRS